MPRNNKMTNSTEVSANAETPIKTEKPEFGIPIVWGKRGAGKTLFSLNSPYTPVHIIDVENSSTDYEQHMARLIELKFFTEPFTRVFTPQWLDFNTEISKIMGLPNHTYGTIVIDTVGQVTEWYKTDQFERDKNIADKMSQVVWGRVRDRLRNLLLGLSKKADMIILLAHEREYNHVVSPRCNPGVLELTSVSVRLVRDPNQQIPDGLITYARLPFWPPRIPQITLSKMLTFIERPADWNKLTDEQKAPPEPIYVPVVPAEGEDE
jgi:hypothetical protein